ELDFYRDIPNFSNIPKIPKIPIFPDFFQESRCSSVTGSSLGSRYSQHSQNSHFFPGIQMFLSNREVFGFLPVPLPSHSSLRDEVENFLHVQLEIMVKLPPAEPSPNVWVPPKVLDKMGFDEVFLINLRRRSDRRTRMLRTLRELGIDPKLVEAVDGRSLNRSQLEALGVRMLPGYRDPFHGRALTPGEVGCFLSHFRVWQEISGRGLGRSLVFEDDLRFEVFFRRRLTELMERLEETGTDWDLIYLGRKRLEPERAERGVPGVRQLLRPGYSYWTLGYALSRSH
ncbi:procollagen galactosyltransferase 1-like, partial [Malurus melanocephalus]|uniref:procollagen galactosyltransferase 1-like n=1 Tax=Malurus melanocephalus TaxID=175006 RepID=UPI002548B484